MTDFTKLKHLSLGQLLSICITCTNLTVTKLSELNVRLPLTLNLLTYLTLTLISYYKLLRTQTHSSLIFWLKQNLWFGFILGVIDVEANFLVIKGFSYTSLLSAMLIGAWSTPMVVILSYFLLGKRYRVNHYIGILLALVGLGVLIFSDYNLQENWWGKYIF
jgi:solute carrier family 35 protein F1/2